MGSGEDIYLTLHHVRHKKHDGTLYLLSRHIGWMPSGKDSFAVSHAYCDIKTQKISPERAAKVQLQVILHDGGASTFQFVNPLGPDAQVRDRDSVKDMLIQLLPKFQRRLDPDLEEKNRILQEDPDLYQLYRDLVVNHVITAEEFWAKHLKPVNKSGVDNNQQDIGVSAAFFADVKVHQDNVYGLKYNLPAEVVQSIFRTYPAVKKKHLEQVPSQLTENEFWTRFLQSHYFHRDRTSISSKDIFSDCLKHDEQDFQEALGEADTDPDFVDLATLEDQSALNNKGETEESPLSSSSHNVNRALIRRFNHHSMMILKATLPPSTQPEPGPPPQKKLCSQLKVGEEELAGDEPSELDDAVPCHTAREPYQHSLKLEYTSPDTLLTRDHCLRQDVASWELRRPPALTETSARKALGDLGAQGTLMARPPVFSKDGVPAVVRQEVARVYLSLQELLRHFWTCFPANTPSLHDKLVNMKNSLDKFYFAKIQPLNELVIKNHCNPELIDHIKSMVQAALAKFQTWQAKKAGGAARM